jgi:ABC-2 type transport system ATP-binding protein
MTQTASTLRGSAQVMLATKSLTRRFGAATAVDALTIAVDAGEVFGLLGPNGAGKSTVIKMLTTLLPPTSGAARVAGFDITHQAVAVRRVIGYVPQALSADGALSGYENLLIFAKLYHLPPAEREQRVREALAFMGLTDAAEKLVRTYSGGMIRRLEIAQSTLHRPRPARAQRRLGASPAAAGRVWRHDLLDHPRHGRSRPALRSGGDHAPGPRGGGWRTRRAQGVDWRAWAHPG